MSLLETELEENAHTQFGRVIHFLKDVPVYLENIIIVFQFFFFLLFSSHSFLVYIFQRNLKSL